MKLDTIVNQPTIETSRFVLRPLRRLDQKLVEFYAGQKEVAYMTTSIAHPLPPGSTELFIARARAEDRIEDVWAIDGSASGKSEIMGMIGLKRLDSEVSEVGFWVAPELWNTGIASIAIRALVATNPLKNRALFASAFQDNPASARVLNNCGFLYLGDAESFSLARNVAVPTWTYSLNLGKK
ncbi:GNAT family N-acetyltransferase [Pseudopelagicola sp. nBUS_19]|uniref:GNAT family N-acetyltransferase n=1 Tax=Pseudopelagicola sp. nBUS_19 TaxID=3395316 RepID=UPI003EBE7C01